MNFDRQFIVHIDSHERLSGSHQDGTYKIEVTNGTIQDYDRVVVLSATIPKSYYSIEDGFNTFTLEEDSPSTSSATIEITPGTYGADEFVDYLPGLLNTQSPNGWTYSMSFNPNTGKFTWTVTGNSGNTARFKVEDSVYEQLGFDKNAELEFTSTLTSTTVIDLSPENNVFLRSNIVEGGGNNSNILQDFQGSGVPPFAQINFQQTELEGYSKGINNSSDIFRFYITNEDDTGNGQRIINLNGKNWTATLLLYKKSTFVDFLKNAVKLFFSRRNN